MNNAQKNIVKIAAFVCILLPMSLRPDYVFARETSPPPALYFVENKGQWPEEVLFRASRDGVVAWITYDGILYDFYRTEYKGASTDETKDGAILDTTRRVGHMIRMNFMTVAKPGAAKSAPKTKKIERPNIKGYKKLVGVHNYLLGNDPAKWATKVPLYSEIDLDDLYDNIDMRLYHDVAGLRYDLIVEPGADPTDIEIEMEGADSVLVDKDGALVIKTSLGDIKHRDLVAYQLNKGRRSALASRFKTKGKNRVTFELPEGYDSTKTLIIDPILFATYIGGEDTETTALNAMEVDADGNSYIAGTTESITFSTTATTSYDSTLAGARDVFVCKLNGPGSQLSFYTYLGGSNQENAYDLAIDDSGNMYVTGRTISSNFPTMNAVQSIINVTGGEFFWDMFVTKINATGSALTYSTFLGGGFDDEAFSIALDDAGAAYIGGSTKSTNFWPFTGAYDDTFSGGKDAVIAKLSPAGNSLEFSSYYGGSATDVGLRIAVDDQRNPYMVGLTESTNLDTSPGAYDATFGGVQDMFVAKFNTTATALTYGTYLGGSGSDIAYGLAINDAGNAFITGHTTSANFPVTGASYQTTHQGDWDIVLCELNSTGSTLLNSTFWGGADTDYAYDIALDPMGGVYIVGSSNSSGLETSAGDAYTSDGVATNFDVVYAKFNADFSALIFASYVGGSGNDTGAGIAVEASGDIHISGTTFSPYPDFPIFPFGSIYDAVIND